MERSTEPDGARVVRVRAYLGGRVRDVRRTFRASAGADPAAFMKRCALAALPKSEGWHLFVVSVERTSEAEPVAAVLDESMQTRGVWSGPGRIPAHGGGGGRCRSWCGG